MGTLEQRMLSYGGIGNRSYNLYLPTDYVRNKNTKKFSLPLLVGFHGGTSNAVALMCQSQMNRIADANTFAVAYVNGTALNPFNLTFNADYCCGYASLADVDDIGFVKTVIAQVKAAHPINTNGIFGFGFSNGAMLCYRIAFDAPTIFRAVAPVAGALPIGFSKEPTNVPILHIHGNDDTHLPVNGGYGTAAMEPVNCMPLSDASDLWTSKNKDIEISSSTTKDYFYHLSKGDYNTHAYYIVLNNGHQWPGGISGNDPSLGRMNSNFNASQVIWNFFKKYL